MNREQWLKERKAGIGASDAAAVVGVSPFKSNTELWEEKTGRRHPKDISNEPYVKYGTEAEKYIRELFALDHPQYKVGYHEFKMIRHPAYPYIFATLDGELTDEQGRRGILEIKTTEIMNSAQWSQWGSWSQGKYTERIPDGYYVQVLHQLLATGWDFADLNAQIKYTSHGKTLKRTETYRIERSEVQQDIDWLLKQEIKFWEHVQKDTAPSLLLPAI